MTNPRLVCLGPGEIGWQDAPLDPLSPGEVRIKNQFGTEKHGTMGSFAKGVANSRGRWDKDLLLHFPGEGMLWSYPIPLGNMQFGEVVDAASPDDQELVGTQVFYHGFFQPEANVPADKTWSVESGITWQDAFVMDPAEFALGAIRDGHFRAGDRAAVFGLGAIGLVLVEMLSNFGAGAVAAFDPVPRRREIAMLNGADRARDPREVDAGRYLKEFIPGGPDVIFDFSGSMHALQAALRGIGYGGTIVMGAFPAPYPAGLDLGGEAHMNRPKLVFTRACSDPNPEHPRWDHARIQREVHNMIERGHIRGKLLFEDPVPFGDLLNVYPQIAKEPGDLIKLCVAY